MQLHQMWCKIVLASIGNGAQRQYTCIRHPLNGMSQSIMQCRGRSSKIFEAPNIPDSLPNISSMSTRHFPLRLLVRVILRLPLAPRSVKPGHHIFPPLAFDVRSMAFDFPFFGGAFLCFSLLECNMSLNDHANLLRL